MSVTLAPTPAQYAALAKTASAYPASSYPPSTFARNIFVRGFSLGLSTTQVLVFLRTQKQTHPGLDTLTANRTITKRLVNASRKAVVSSSSAGREQNLQRVAARTVALLFSDNKGTPQDAIDDDLDDAEWAAAILEPRPAAALKPVSAAAQLRQRVALATVANEVSSSLRSEQAWSTAMISYNRMNLLTAWTTSTSKKALSEIVDARWITEVPSASKARARRFKVAGRVSKELRPIVRAQADATNQFAGKEGPDSLVATLLANVSHPAWNYSADALTYKVWWVAAVDAASMDPAGLGVTKRSASIARRQLAEAGLDTSATSEEFMLALDAYATDNGCWDAWREAERSYAEHAEARALEIRTHQGYKADALAILDQYTGDTTKMPKVDAATGAKFARWLESSTAAFSGREMPAVLVGHIHTLLARRIAKRTGHAEVASSVAGWILVKVDIDGNLTAKLARRITAGRGLEHVAGNYREMPRGDAPDLEQKQWLLELRAKLTEKRAMSPEMAASISTDLLARMVLQGYEVAAATRASQWAVRDVAIIPAITPAAVPATATQAA